MKFKPINSTVWQFILIVAVVGIMLSPVPEKLIGRWLQLSNDFRPQTGRAHDRRLKASLGMQLADSLDRGQETRVRAAAQINSAHTLRKYLLRYNEARMTANWFRTWYLNLPERIQQQIIKRDKLLELVRNQGFDSVLFRFVDGSNGRVRLSFNDIEGNRIMGAEIAFTNLAPTLNGLKLIQTAVESFQFDDPNQQEFILEQWYHDKEILPECVTAKIEELALDPEISLERLLLINDTTIYCEIKLIEKYFVYEFPCLTSEIDSNYVVPRNLNKRKRWFGL
jgi:hypothetical protein